MRALLISMLTLFTTSVFAQNEVERQLSSLNGIKEFGVVINIEKPKRLKEANLSVSSLRNQMLEVLYELPVAILEDETLRESDRYPILYLHINVMFVAPGIYSYGAQIRFYQPAKLTLQGDLQTMAVTWQKGLVGAASPDLAETIAREAINLTEVFVSDYTSVN